MYFKFLCFVFFIFSNSTVFSQVDFVIETDQLSKLENVPVLIDQNYSFEEILNNPALKFTKQSHISVKDIQFYWIKLNVATNFAYDKSFFIWATPTFNNRLFYFDEDTKKWQSKRGGDLIANNRTIYKALPCVFKAQQPTTIYIKVDVSEVNHSELELKTEIYFKNQRESLALRKSEYDWWLATVAIVLAFWIYNLYWYLMIREKVYLYYLILIIGSVIYITSVGSFMSFFVPYRNISATITKDHVILQNLPEFIYTLFGITLVYFGLVQFIRNYLKSKNHFPKLDQILKYFLFLLLTYQILYIIVDNSKLFLQNNIYNLINNLIILVILILIIMITIKSRLKKTPESLYLLKAIFIPILLLLLTVIYMIVIQKNNVMGFLPNLAILSITISFGILLVAKVNLIKKELIDEKFEKQAVIAQNEIEIERNLRLQEKIEYDKNEVAAAEHIKLLMKELHHRVKNNLQIVSSFLSLQSFRIKDQAAMEAVKEGQHRIEAMSLIHQKLYIQDNITQVNIREFITDIAESLMEAYGFSKQNFGMEIFVSEDLLEVDKAIPLSIILNELITNAFKYAYTDINHPELKIYFTKKHKKATLLIADNGNGIDLEAWKNNDGYGKELVSTFTEQLSGTLTLSVSDGTIFQIDFPY